MNDITFQHYLIGLLAVANNIPAIAPYLILTRNLEEQQKRRLSLIITITAFIVMSLSFFFGTLILSFFGISVSAFQIAGGLLLGGAGMNMLNSKGSNDIKDKQVEKGDVNYSNSVSTSIVPIAIPLTTGAGTMSTITVFSEAASASGSQIQLALAILIMTTIIYVSFRFVERMNKFLGAVGMSVMTKIMGLFTLAIGVQFVVEGVRTIVKSF